MEFPTPDRRRDRCYNIIDHNKDQEHHHSSSSSSEEREHMFEKVVTPSDVGKLNRLVIPKQHAERYFPLDPASNEKGGLLLSFEEDRTGRPWHFRYSYWNSSQSYVMTKGWTRFVKDKRLGAGDTVAFSRATATGRLFIDWRRRPLPPDPPLLLRSLVVPTWGWGGLFLPPPPTPMGPTPLRMDDGILDSVPVSCGAEPKRVRLFGVNLDCYHDQEQGDQYLMPPTPLQWRLSPMPMDQDGKIKKGSF